MRSQNAYAILGIEPWADEQRIRRAYRDLAKRCHPDVDPSAFAAERFRTIHTAYRVLLDPEARRRHDREVASPAWDRPVPHTTAWRPVQRRDRTPPTRVQRFAFVGLHATGALFCSTLIMGILVGITFLEWPVGLLLFTVPGIALLPDSFQGMRGR